MIIIVTVHKATNIQHEFWILLYFIVFYLFFLFTESQQFHYYYDFIINLRTYSQYNIVIHSLLFGWTTQTVCVCGFVCIHNLQNIQWIQLIKLWLVREKIVVRYTCMNSLFESSAVKQYTCIIVKYKRIGLAPSD